MNRTTKKIAKTIQSWLIFGLLMLSVNHAFADAPSWFRGLQNKAVFSSERVRAELVVHVPQGIVAGEEFWIGLKITHQPEWHSYWKNPGDVGIETKLIWDLPQGMAASDIHWPTPQILEIAEGITDYGYEGDLLLPVKVTVSESIQEPQVDIKLHASWLACRIECIPESADFTLSLATQQSTISETGLFEAAQKQTPVTSKGVDAQVTVTPKNEVDGEGDGFTTWLITGLPPHWQGQRLHLLPEQNAIITNQGPESVDWKDGTWMARYNLSYNRTTEPEQLDAILMLADQSLASSDQSDQMGIRITAAVTGDWPAQQEYEIPPSLLEEIPSTQNTSVQQTTSSSFGKVANSLLLILGLAFMGGLLLNLMPCVFPVLSITALSIAGAGQAEARTQKIGGLAYAVGTVATMMFLAVLLLILRSGGAALGWGFQLQSPLFVSLLAGIFVLIALNLLGVYEIKMFLPQTLSNMRSKNPAIDSFCSGIIAVLVATPCTAPFMGAALGAALVMPAWQTLLIFFALGLGLALPLMLLTFIPQLSRWLPAPGAWMITFKQLMAFPMLAAALWLVWVVSIQTGIDGGIGLLAILLNIAFLVWILGWLQKTKITSTVLKLGALLLSAILIIGALYWFAADIQVKPQNNVSDSEAMTINDNEEGAVNQHWQAWSRERVDALLAQNKIVFVDFTAAWCVTCQMNKKTTLRQSNVIDAFEKKGIVLLQADWTNNNPLITAEIERLGRSGVPVYALYQMGQEPVLLPEILTPQIVYDALSVIP